MWLQTTEILVEINVAFILFNWQDNQFIWQDNQFILGRAGNLVLTTGLKT